ncbi:unnamed protein product [Caretta caretta]
MSHFKADHPQQLEKNNVTCPAKQHGFEGNVSDMSVIHCYVCHQHLSRSEPPGLQTETFDPTGHHRPQQM